MKLAGMIYRWLQSRYPFIKFKLRYHKLYDYHSVLEAGKKYNSYYTTIFHITDTEVYSFSPESPTDAYIKINAVDRELFSKMEECMAMWDECYELYQRK